MIAVVIIAILIALTFVNVKLGLFLWALYWCVSFWIKAKEVESLKRQLANQAAGS